METDFRISDQGSIVLIEPVSDAAREWTAENVQLENWQWLGPAFTVDHRMADPLIAAIVDDGFAVSQ
jgi:hypothetical protein